MIGDIIAGGDINSRGVSNRTFPDASVGLFATMKEYGQSGGYNRT